MSAICPERALAETFGVSRNSVREAIRTLSEQGILKSRHGDGTYICGSDLAPLTAALLNAVDTEGKSFDHIMEFRLVIEPSIARIATARHSAEQLHQLKIIVCGQGGRPIPYPFAGAGDMDSFHDRRRRMWFSSTLSSRV